MALFFLLRLFLKIRFSWSPKTLFLSSTLVEIWVPDDYSNLITLLTGNRWFSLQPWQGCRRMRFFRCSFFLLRSLFIDKVFLIPKNLIKSSYSFRISSNPWWVTDSVLQRTDIHHPRWLFYGEQVGSGCICIFYQLPILTLKRQKLTVARQNYQWRDCFHW